MDGVAGIADSLLDFNSSIEKQMTANLMTGKQMNFMRARELALVGDTEGMMNEVLNQVGSEEEFLAMNVKQREALAAAAGTDLATLMKLVSKEEEQKTLMGEIGKMIILLYGRRYKSCCWIYGTISSSNLYCRSSFDLV